jgi:hypothetical protein
MRVMPNKTSSNQSVSRIVSHVFTVSLKNKAENKKKTINILKEVYCIRKILLCCGLAYFVILLSRHLVPGKSTFSQKQAKRGRSAAKFKVPD